eukprot:scaffold173295_cov41-Attheya_sp.AAC.2
MCWALGRTGGPTVTMFDSIALNTVSRVNCNAVQCSAVQYRSILLEMAKRVDMAHTDDARRECLVNIVKET